MQFKILQIQGVDVMKNVNGPEEITYTSKIDMDADGPNDNPFGDKSWQPTTSLKWFNQNTNEWEYVDSLKVDGVVANPHICIHTKGIVLGCQAYVSYLNGPWIPAVCYDVGPWDKIGEASCHLGETINSQLTERGSHVKLNHSPVNGGDQSFQSTRYRILPGVPAEVNGIKYQLQHYR